jgi:acyl-CoA dehydrogenase
MSELTTFRAETRAWLEANCPASMRAPMSDDDIVWGGRHPTFKHPDQKVWLERMAGRGWTAPTWPTEYGGGGLAEEHARVLAEEMRRLGCRDPLKSFGITMLGPVLLEYGTPEQKREHLPKVVRGEIRWCQGYSEPEAGSDLASLRTRAVREGDHFVVNGHKIWTSYAHHADWIFCLVRTDPAARKHDGISFVLIDMASAGVRATPIQLISGASVFCETFFENVRVPTTNLVGEENRGWAIAKRLLEHERKMIGTVSDAHRATADRPLEVAAKAYVGVIDGRIADPRLRDRIAEWAVDDCAYQLTRRRLAEEASATGTPGPASALIKLYATELNKRRMELHVASAGTAAFGWDGDGFSPEELRMTRAWLRSKANSIEGGTSEIQLNIIAKRVLGLPD